MPFNTPILFLVFNRPDTTSKVFDAIKKLKPTNLYIAADGPRDNRPDDDENCKKTLDIVRNIDWDCEIKTLFRKENLGCKVAVSSAIDWFFNNVEEGIILEDDCLPDQSFFQFCSELLEKYRNDNRIMQICGFNALNKIDIPESYYFSKYGPIWGWASWRRAWKYYDVNMTMWPEIKKNKLYYSFCDSKKEVKWRIRLYDKIYNNVIDTWDYQWGLTKMTHSGLSIIPNQNLIQNIGFGESSTHTHNNSTQIIKYTISFPLINPIQVSRNTALDKRFFNEFVKPKKIKLFFKKIFR